MLLRIDAGSLRLSGGQTDTKARIHDFAATSLARRLKTVNMLLRDADI